MSAPVALPLTHRRRLRELWRSAGWPCRDAVEVDLLAAALNEGIAEFVTELASGRISNAHLRVWTAGHEAEIAQRFAAAMDGTDYSAWLYNGVGTPEAPGDLGYWVGYRTARAYYAQAQDKRQAVKNMLLATDAKTFLAASGWAPHRP